VFSPLLLELAHIVERERLQEAAHHALIRQLPARRSTGPVAVAFSWLPNRLRALAACIEGSFRGEPCVLNAR
jgi:hypothetical protein